MRGRPSTGPSLGAGPLRNAGRNVAHPARQHGRGGWPETVRDGPTAAHANAPPRQCTPRPWHIGDRADASRARKAPATPPQAAHRTCTGAACALKVFSSYSAGVQQLSSKYSAALQKACGAPSATVQMLAQRGSATVLQRRGRHSDGVQQVFCRRAGNWLHRCDTRAGGVQAGCRPVPAPMRHARCSRPGHGQQAGSLPPACRQAPGAHAFR